MLRRQSIRSLACIVAASAAAKAQTSPVPIRAVTAPAASTSTPLISIDELREIAGGRVLVNSGNARQLLLLDASLSHPTVLADTTGSAAVYPRFGRLIPYLGDSTFFFESDSRSLVVIDPAGKLGAVRALPRPQDFNNITSGGPVGTDARGRLVYQGRRAFGFPPACRPAGDVAPPAPPAPPPTDSVVIIRADFESRTVDTVGKSKTVLPGLSFPITTADANCKVLSAKVRVNPSTPSTDSWTVTSRGAIAIVRGHDYHVDWIDADGQQRATAKMAFDWRRLADADKQAKIDSARKIVDSLTNAGGYRMQVCNGGRSTVFNTNPPAASDGGGLSGVLGGGSGGGGGRGGGAGVASASASGGDSPAGPGRPSDCQTLAVAAEFVPLDSMADYIAPIREQSARADLDGNVWILPSTSAGAKGGLLYDVVSPSGDVVERVQLPGDRDIAGFGRNGVLYLRRGTFTSGFIIEKVKVVR